MLNAAPDPMADVAPGILGHMNGDHVDSMITLPGRTRNLKRLKPIDRFGFCLRLKAKEGMESVRIKFPSEVTTTQETEEVLVKMVRDR